MQRCYLCHILNETLMGLDVGCGSGEVAKNVQQLCLLIEFWGVDILVRKDVVINTIKFDGYRLPFKDNSFDFMMLVDVVHHADDPIRLIKECTRVSLKFILIKDHLCESWWDRARLCFMDWVHNRGYDVYLPYNFLSMKEWEKVFQVSNVVCETEIHNLYLYPRPFSYLFDSTLHFISRLAIQQLK